MRSLKDLMSYITNMLTLHTFFHVMKTVDKTGDELLKVCLANFVVVC